MLLHWWAYICYICNRYLYRYSYVLGCKWIKGSHTYFTEIINEITHNILNSKISNTVTDIASNFGKAFGSYSLKSIGQESLNTNSDNWFDNETICYNNHNTGKEIDYFSTDFDTVDWPTVFYNFGDTEIGDICLLYHIICSYVHTLSLIATVDVHKIYYTKSLI